MAALCAILFSRRDECAGVHIKRICRKGKISLLWSIFAAALDILPRAQFVSAVFESEITASAMATFSPISALT